MCETGRLGAIPCLVSCQPQRMLRSGPLTVQIVALGSKMALRHRVSRQSQNIRCDFNKKKMEEESTRATELALYDHCNCNRRNVSVTVSYNIYMFFILLFWYQSSG